MLTTANNTQPFKTMRELALNYMQLYDKPMTYEFRNIIGLKTDVPKIFIIALFYWQLQNRIFRNILGLKINVPKLSKKYTFCKMILNVPIMFLTCSYNVPKIILRYNFIIINGLQRKKAVCKKVAEFCVCVWANFPTLLIENELLKGVNSPFHPIEINNQGFWGRFNLLCKLKMNKFSKKSAKSSAPDRKNGKIGPFREKSLKIKPLFL